MTAEEKIKILREKREQINAEIKRLTVRERGERDYDGEVEFPLVYSLEVSILARRHRKLKTFPQHELPHTVLALRWPYRSDVVSGLPLFLYLGNKKKPDAGRYHMEIKINPMEEF